MMDRTLYRPANRVSFRRWIWHRRRKLIPYCLCLLAYIITVAIGLLFIKR
jgi:hypothetical protein